MARSIRGYMGYNKSVLMKGLTYVLKNVIQPDLLKVLVGVANEMIDMIEQGDEDYLPIWTGTLRNSIGIAIYSDGTLNKFFPMKVDASDEAGYTHGKMGWGQNWYDIDGREFLEKTIRDASTTFSKGIWFVIISAAPYSEIIDLIGSPWGRGQDFFKITYREAAKKILNNLQRIGASVTTSTGTSL